MTASNRVWIGLAAGLVLLASTRQLDAGNNDALLAKPPKGAVVLFAGKDCSAWEHRRRETVRPCEWIVTGGALEVKPGAGSIISKQRFEDFQLRVEFNLPEMPAVKGQERGNSGVYLHGLYEVQVLDSYNNETYAKGMCGAIYELKAPDQNVCRPAGQWQSYDITFRGPRLDGDGKVVMNPRVTVLQNGVQIHKDVEITTGPTRASLPGPAVKAGPILLQDHGCKVKFRNIWVKPLKGRQ